LNEWIATSPWKSRKIRERLAPERMGVCVLDLDDNSLPSSDEIEDIFKQGNLLAFSAREPQFCDFRGSCHLHEGTETSQSKQIPVVEDHGMPVSAHLHVDLEGKAPLNGPIYCAERFSGRVSSWSPR
jgi:hypothetical protein